MLMQRLGLFLAAPPLPPWGGPCQPGPAQGLSLLLVSLLGVKAPG